MNKLRSLRFAGIVASFLLCTIVALFMVPVIVKVNNAVADVKGISSSTWLRMSSEQDEASVDLNVTDPNGNFAASSEEEKVKFNVRTNNYSGYTLTMIGYHGSSLFNEETGASIASINAPTSEADFSATTASSYNNKWGINPSKCINNCSTTNPTYTSLSDDKYLPILATGTTIDTTNVANMTTPNEYTIGIGVRAGADRPEGTYTNTFTLSATTNPVTYSITYVDNTGDTSVANLPATESDIIEKLEIPLSDTIPTRENYTFLNWCLGTAENNGTTCNGRSYRAGDDFDLNKTINPTYTLYAIWSPNITIKVGVGSTRIAIGERECTSSCTITGLRNGIEYPLSSTMAPFYNFASYDMTSGSVLSDKINTQYIPGAYPTTITPVAQAAPYTINLNGNGATNNYTQSAIVNYYATKINTIETLPTRSYSVSGFTASAAGENSTISSTDSLTSTYTFAGWYSNPTTSDNNKVADNTNNPSLLPNTSYTNENSEWDNTSGNATLYAGWTDGAVTLPTVTRTGSTCGWATSENANSYTYNSGQTIYPERNLNLYAVCKNNITLNANGGTLRSGSTIATYNQDSLARIDTPLRASDVATRTVSGFTKGNGANNATISSTNTLNSTSSRSYDFDGWYEEAAATNKIADDSSTPKLRPNTVYTNNESKWNYTEANPITLYAGWDISTSGFSEVELPEIELSGHTCGWDTNPNATTFAYRSEQTIVPDDSIVLYGICTPNTYNVYLDPSGGTGSATYTVVYGTSNWNGPAITPEKEDTTASRTVSGFIKAMGANDATISSTGTLTSTSTTSYAFTGWYNEYGNKIATNDPHPTLIPNSSYTDANGNWTRGLDTTLYAGWNGTASAYSEVTLPTITLAGHTCGWNEEDDKDNPTTISYASGATITPTKDLELYGVCSVDTYTVNLDANGGNYGSTTTTVTYGQNTLAPITIPNKPEVISIRKVSGFTKGTTASMASISDTVERNSSSTTTFTFTGWYKEPETENQITNESTTPRLLANTAYTDGYARWNYTDKDNPVTLYAGYARNAGSFNSITLPTINATGYTCGWAETENATEIEYTSGQSFVPQKNMTLYGVCIANTYHQTVQVRYQNADGTFGSYQTYSECTMDKYYGETHSCSIAATTEYQAAELESYIVYGNETKQMDIYRNTNTVTLTAGTGIASVSVTGTGVKTGSGTVEAEVYYGGEVTIDATLIDDTYVWVKWINTADSSDAYADQTQVISNIVSDIALTAKGRENCEEITGNMQSAGANDSYCSGATGSMTDSRDNQTYTIAKLGDGKLWMTQNLRFTGTSIDSSTTNIDTSKTISYGDLTSGDSYDEARIHDSGNTTAGVWYNYAAASAGTITGSSDTSEAQYSLCPKGWRLPTNSEQSAIRSYLSAYSPVGGGFYNYGSLANTSWGYWWSSTARNGNCRYNLNWNTSSLNSTFCTYRYDGYYIRCVRSS